MLAQRRAEAAKDALVLHQDDTTAYTVSKVSLGTAKPDTAPLTETNEPIQSQTV